MEPHFVDDPTSWFSDHNVRGSVNTSSRSDWDLGEFAVQADEIGGCITIASVLARVDERETSEGVAKLWRRVLIDLLYQRDELRRRDRTGKAATPRAGLVGRAEIERPGLGPSS